MGKRPHPVLADPALRPADASAIGGRALISEALRKAIVATEARLANEKPQAEYAEFRDHPVEFFDEILGAPLWGAEDSPTGHPGQVGASKLYAEHDYVAIGGCRGSTKSRWCAGTCLHFVYTRPRSAFITTAFRWPQVESLWREIRYLHANAKRKLPGELLRNRLEIGELHYGAGYSTNDPIGMQGHRAPGGVLFAVDEAAGVPQEIFQVGSGYATVGNSKTILLGNLNLGSGYFFDAFEDLGGKNGDLFKSMRISAFDVPESFRGQMLMDREWIERTRKAARPVPEEDPVYRVQVMALPPLTDETTLFTRSMLEAAQDLQPEIPGLTMGVDVAWMGSDRCVAVLNDRGRIKGVHQWTHARYHESAEIVIQLKESWGVQRWQDVKVEQDGIGSALIDDLWRRGHVVEKVVMGGAPLEDWDHIVGQSHRVKNRRNELHYVAWRLMQQGGLAIPAIYEHIWDDLQRIRKIEQGQGHFAVESKEKYKKRVGRSPDYSDAVLISLSRGGAGLGASVGSTRGSGHRARDERDRRRSGRVRD